MVTLVTTEHLLVRALCAGDRAEFVRVHEISREHFRPWMPALAPAQTLVQFFEAELARSAADASGATELRLVGIANDGRLAGFFSLSQIFRRSFQNAYAGWSVAADQVGKGMATEGVGALLDLAFAPEPEGLGLHRVQANVIPSNVASVRVAEKVGFRLEGLAERYLKISGTWHDHLMFAKTAEEQAFLYLNRARRVPTWGSHAPGQ